MLKIITLSLAVFLFAGTANALDCCCTKNYSDGSTTTACGLTPPPNGSTCQDINGTPFKDASSGEEGTMVGCSLNPSPGS